MHFDILADLLSITALAVVVLLVGTRLRIPLVVGFLITGLIAGPDGMGLVHAQEEVEHIAELGVVLLLFTIGLEFSASQITKLGRSAMIAGTLQVVLTGGVVALIASTTSISLGGAIALGCMVALSSTAIVLKLLQERAEMDAPHGRTVFAILIYQDMAVVGMILMVPALAAPGGDLLSQLAIALFKSALILVAGWALARWLIPRVLFHVVRTRSRELFALTTIVIALGVPWLAGELGLPLGIGAFVAGMIIADTDYSHQAMAGIQPYRDVFTSLFFISIGMLLDIDALLAAPFQILLLGTAMVVLKVCMAVPGVLLLRHPLRPALMAGLYLAQIGEFSFVLADQARQAELIDGGLFQQIVAITIISMAMTPLLAKLAPRIADAVVSLPLPAWLNRQIDAVPDQKIRDHLIIVGFGVTGRSLAQAATHAGMPQQIIELNAETVRREKSNGVPIHYGDASSEHVLEHLGIDRARTLAITLPDPVETRKITHTARHRNPGLLIVARTRFASEIEHLLRLGADEVVADEFEASVETVARVLRRHMVPLNDIDRYMASVRADAYDCLRHPESSSPMFGETSMGGGEPPHLTTVRVPEGSPLAGKTLQQLELRARFGLTLLAIQREGRLAGNPGAGEAAREGDLWIVFGRPEDAAVLAKEFDPPPGESEPLA